MPDNYEHHHQHCNLNMEAIPLFAMHKRRISMRQVAGVVNVPPRQIGRVVSRSLTLGFAGKLGNVVLFAPDTPVPNGSRLF